ncbi:Gfo/Idh/MocA family oxidoreductase [Paenibacillus sp. GYB004]|uniref:Gfo/Idh/MocA family protein n=1 Tax=Paenibacillus sp. GYB004 TaxID=2994393 RepID=UPI002F96DEEC
MTALENRQKLNIGMIGLDTSHVLAFMKLLHDKEDPWHVPGGKVVAAYPGGSPDFPSSITKIPGYTATLRDEYGVRIVDSPEEVAEASDAVLLHSVDGRVHLSQFHRIAGYGKPVFIDKPFAVSSADAREMVRLAEAHRVPLMSASSLRYVKALQDAIEGGGKSPIIGADACGPMALEPTQPGLFWYGIHTVEMLYAVMGKGCVQVTSVTSNDHDVTTGLWSDGRIGVIRGNRTGNGSFGVAIHREKGIEWVHAQSDPKPKYASLLEIIMEMFRTGASPLPASETLEVIRFIEAANESRKTGQSVNLAVGRAGDAR